MDFLIFWVVLAIVVEGTRAAVFKYCRPQPEGEGLEESLLGVKGRVDTPDTCKLTCCANRWEAWDVKASDSVEAESMYSSEEEIVVHLVAPAILTIDEQKSKTNGKGKSLIEEPILIVDEQKSTTNGKGKGLVEEPILAVDEQKSKTNGKGKSLIEEPILTVDEQKSKTNGKGKGLIDESETDFVQAHRAEDLIRPNSAYASGDKRGRGSGKISAKVYPESPEIQSNSNLRAPLYKLIKSEHTSYDYGSAPCGQFAHRKKFPDEFKVPPSAGECSYSA